MRLSILLSIFLFSCSTFTELKPDPKLSAKENGFIELKNQDEYFELQKDEKYVIHFPKAPDDQFYLVIALEQQAGLTYYFTNAFQDGKELGKVFADESPLDSLVVYPIGNSVPTYFWAIDQVKQDAVLRMTYRYVPAWRFRFENNFAELKSIVADSKLPAEPYTTWAKSPEINLASITALNTENDNRILTLNDVSTKLDGIAKLMPAQLPKDDAAVKSILELKSELKQELERSFIHQRLLKAYLSLLEAERYPSKFTANAKAVAAALSDEKLPILVRPDLENRTRVQLNRTQQYIQDTFSKKSDLSPILVDLESLETINSKINSVDKPALQRSFAALKQFNFLAPRYTELLGDYKDVLARPISSSQWPQSTDYAARQAELTTLARSVNALTTTDLQSQQSSPAVKNLKSGIRTLQLNLRNSISDHDKAAPIADEINLLRLKQDYFGIIKLVKNNASVDFLSKHYAHVDRLAIQHEQTKLSKYISEGQYALAEGKLATFSPDYQFIEPANIQSYRKVTISTIEDELYQSVHDKTKTRIDSIIAFHAGDFTGVKDRYESDELKAAYILTYSSKGQVVIDDRNRKISDYVTKRVSIDYPERAIELLYNALIKNQEANGVERAQAVVEHGNRYKGKQASIWNMVNECDPHRGKRLSNAGSYRKLMALPLSLNKSAVNEYMFKVNIVIPSDAKFPAYEMNIKLPPSVATSAKSSQWFEVIRLNGDEIRPEGRISITAPTAANGYEFQITPIQTKKGENNSFEVRFKSSEYRVFNISIMAQEPLIRKH
jgi:hypothetical protein